MNQLELILKTFQEYEFKEGLDDLFYLSGNLLKEIYPTIMLEYNQDTAFFMALKTLLESGDISLFYNLNFEDLSRDGELLTGSAEEQIKQLKQVWIGSDAINKMDEENNYIGWYFLIQCPYALAHKIYDKDGNFERWFCTG
ncbi:DUF596 domain-containing protein [Acinetobacter pittii]|uniref:DUF596 domain-containing protein n=1 Tax=Acinetobacter pittii TaxID=48296 RepID=UPI000D3AC28B|nr:DUF596 domain-containing protein [Acinetobacter pittii]PTV44756.1 hypothetical protein DBL01_17880 [Acinetobacter pittii]